MKILDACCGSKMMWNNRKNTSVVFGDQRRETISVTDRSNGKVDGQRILRIAPDVQFDFRSLPFPDNAFNLVAFDPPHLERVGQKSWLVSKYGKLGRSWRDDLRQGFSECFRVLKTDGVLVFKWNETQVAIKEVLALAPASPLFGNLSGRSGKTHWLVFMKRLAKEEQERITNVSTDVLKIYEDTLKAIAGLKGPLTGEDATCFRTWAEEALVASNQSIQSVLING